jgi:hypothetical protein
MNVWQGFLLVFCCNRSSARLGRGALPHITAFLRVWNNHHFSRNKLVRGINIRTGWSATRSGYFLSHYSDVRGNIFPMPEKIQRLKLNTRA